MKIILGLVTLVALTACCGCGQPPETHINAQTSLSCSTAKVSGMVCEACSMTITKNLKQIKGVSDVQVDVASGLVKIYTDKNHTVNAAAVKPIIEKSGYTFQSLQPDCQS